MRHSGRQTGVGKSMRCVPLRFVACVCQCVVCSCVVDMSVAQLIVFGRVVRAVCGRVRVVSVVRCVTHIYMHKAGAGVCCVCVHVRVYVLCASASACVYVCGCVRVHVCVY